MTAGGPGALAGLARRVGSPIARVDRRLGRWVEGGPGRGLALSLGLGAIFLAAATVRFHPFVDDVSPATSRWDDWLSYKERALSILHGGLTIPVIGGSYTPPRGFLYNYFVAAVFACFGENAAYVYVVQAGMLGVSVAVMYLAIRPRLPPAGGVLYLAVLLLSSMVDVFWKYSGRLLSENLTLFWLPFFFLAFFRALDRPRIRWALMAGLTLGLATLARPGLLLVGPVMGAWLALRSPAGRRLVAPAVFLGAFGLLLNLIGLRDYAATGRFTLGAISTTQGWTPLVARLELGSGPFLMLTAWQVLHDLVVRVLYALGFLFVLGAKYPVAPHWFVMWGGVAAFAAEGLRARRVEAWQGVLLVFIAVALAPVIVVSDVANYGIRMVLVVLPAAWALAIYWVAAQLDGAVRHASPGSTGRA